MEKTKTAVVAGVDAVSRRAKSTKVRDKEFHGLAIRKASVCP